jgi:hypothetical protein
MADIKNLNEKTQSPPSRNDVAIMTIVGCSVGLLTVSIWNQTLKRRAFEREWTVINPQLQRSKLFDPRRPLMQARGTMSLLSAWEPISGERWGGVCKI